jgi:hypothetical protein
MPSVELPAIPDDPKDRVGLLGTWIKEHRGYFTDTSLERIAVKAGYTHDEFIEAVAILEARSRDSAGIGPLKKTARWFVLGAYGATWLFFAIPYLGPWATSYGSLLQTILTIALAVGLAISLIVIQLARPDPGRPGRAMTILLVVPVILLLGVAGSCLPFAGQA